MTNTDLICSQVAKIYQWLDKNISQTDNDCNSCGDCCRFDTFGHKLYITSPELLYFRQNVKAKPMTDGLCPYMKNNKCSIRNFRFAGCRIFFCRGNDNFQSKLSEEAIEKFKIICEKFDLPYQYTDLAAALNNF